MTYETALKLKEAGFPQEVENARFKRYYNGEEMSLNSRLPPGANHELYERLRFPSLEELIEACGKGFTYLWQTVDGWVAGQGNKRGDWTMTDGDQYPEAEGSTPSEAVANLWLALNKK